MAPEATEGCWVEPASARDDERAAARGLRPVRDVLQLRCVLPLPASAGTSLRTRAFQPGSDEHAWLALNNRAFAWHPEQGGWDEATLEARLAEPWVDAEDLRLHEVDGELAGFCWTKPHLDERPPLGEIYVIAVDPDVAGRGLGRGLTLAGLAHLHERYGVGHGMLYVESDNERALALYHDLGFTLHQVRRRYEPAGAARGAPSSGGVDADEGSDGVGDGGRGTGDEHLPR